MPFTAVVNHAGVKAALLCAAVDPSVSCIVSGRRGTAKSVLCRSVQTIMPKIVGEDGVARAPRFVGVPLGITEDRIAGTIDIDASVRGGAPVFSPGILANAHEGVLYIDEINLLDDAALALIQSSLSDGVVRAEREGLSVAMPCRALALASFNPAENELRAHVIDRFAIICSTDEAEELSNATALRIEAINGAMLWQDDWRRVVREHEDEQRELRQHLEMARRILPDVYIAPEHVARIVKIASECAIQGHRGEIFGAKVARTSAALRHSLEVNDADVNMAISLVILPRATRSPPDDALTPPKKGDFQMTSTENQSESEKTEDEPENEEEEVDSDFGAPELEPQVQEADESQLDVKSLLEAFEKAMRVSFAEKKRASRSTLGGKVKRQSVFDLMRGRYVKPMFPKAGQIRGKIAIDATLRAAAPHQIIRRRRHPESNRKIFITKDDVRLKKLSRKAAALTVFVVDASGSMAMNRMSVAKAAVIRLLRVSYSKRDLVALIELSGDEARVVLPPTRSTVFVSRRLTAMPCGGGTPLAHGLAVAARVAINAARARGKSTVGIVRVVVITDGRPTRSLAWSENPTSRVDAIAPTRQALREEVLDVALRVRRLGFVRVLVVDTDSAFVSDHFAHDLAERIGGAYLALPKLDQSSAFELVSALA